MFKPERKPFHNKRGNSSGRRVLYGAPPPPVQEEQSKIDEVPDDV